MPLSQEKGPVWQTKIEQQLLQSALTFHKHIDPHTQRDTKYNPLLLPTPNTIAASQNNVHLFIYTQWLWFNVGCTVQPSNARRRPKKDSALSPAEKLKHLWEAQCFSVFQALLGLLTFLPLCLLLQGLPQTDFKSSPSDPGAGEAAPPRLPGTYQGDMYLSKWALVSESQLGILFSSQGDGGTQKTTSDGKTCHIHF